MTQYVEIHGNLIIAFKMKKALTHAIYYPKQLVQQNEISCWDIQWIFFARQINIYKLTSSKTITVHVKASEQGERERERKKKCRILDSNENRPLCLHIARLHRLMRTLYSLIRCLLMFRRR